MQLNTTFQFNRVELVLMLLAAALCCANAMQDEDLQSRVDDYLESRVANNEQVEVLVARGDHVLIQSDYRFGKNRHTSATAAVSSRFLVGSIAEQFVAAAVLQLNIKVDASICTYLPHCPSAWNDVQVLHLLTHSSGLPEKEPTLPGPTGPEASDYVDNSLQNSSQATLEFKPGTKVRYNKVDFELLYLMITDVSGEEAQKYIETNLFRPLKMTHTYYTPERRERGTKTAGSPQRVNDAISTVADLFLWSRALTKGTVLSQESLQRMFTPYRDGHALGWKIVKEFDRRAALQSSNLQGISVSLRLFPDDDIWIIVMARAPHADSAEVTHDLAALVVGKNKEL